MKDWLEDLSRARATHSTEWGRPLVTVAFAMSADGCLAAARGQRSEISCEDAQRFTHRVRGAHAAVLIGIGTALADDPLLTTRFGEGSTGLRIVLDSNLRLPITSRLLTADATPALVVGAEGADPVRASTLEGAGARVLLLPRSPRGVSISALVEWLHRNDIDSLMVEGGANVIESFFREGPVDHLAVTCSPKRFDQPAAVRLTPSLEREVRDFMIGEGRAVGTDRIHAGPFARQKSLSRPVPAVSKAVL